MRGEIENAGYLAFFDALVEGRLKLGQTLTQDELCQVLGLSLSPMRETTTLLEAEGLITVRRKVGITIFYPDVKFVGNCFQFRGLLEREGLRKFARSVTPAWIATMRKDHEEIIEFVAGVNDIERYRIPVKELERRFHNTFIASYENDQIRVNYARLTQKMYLLRLHNMNAVGPANTVTSMEEHLAIIDALGVGDVEGAVEGLDRHLQGVLHRVLTT
ncbi:MAG: putative transcriptional regulator GntR family protein [Devosia sp.]|uniref:GntR family transcriptional regulator n=1 Tax=Devosia sp. TaxID=1871048 RepID=UPI00261B0E16|nr:GntR family transcriptional regulator [Devosia sp.]MDB5541055.1 putative transcriptional regulator GntR family protein [Devosia sp.]